MTEEITPENAHDNSTEGSRRLSAADFASARELYELGTAGLVELAEKFGVSRQTLSKRFRDAGVVGGSRSHEIAASTAAAAKSASAVTVARFADKRPEYIEETQQQGYQILKQAKLLGQKIVADAIKASRSLETADGDLKALGRYVKIQTELLASTLDLLKADEFTDEESLPQLKFEDLTVEDIVRHMEQNGIDPDPSNINIEGLEEPKNGS